MVTTAGPARRTAAATNDWRARVAAAPPWARAAPAMPPTPSTPGATGANSPAASSPEHSQGQVRTPVIGSAGQLLKP